MSKLGSRHLETQRSAFCGCAENIQLGCFRFVGQNTHRTRTAVGALREYNSGNNLWDDVVLDAERCAAGHLALNDPLDQVDQP